ncbi:hypothetical protein BD310DRAFT_912152 [Dichomitus squalens]|uniref:DUF7918 domain-containing protein n=1 Tax=Dichomitus squalens TaxID=114155 RepID=A0A4Q9QF42_9APHY|nr:hypothetical protein BD310DRAFT_912152 [Dichomitus squalens]
MPLKHRGYGAYISCNDEEVQTHKPKAEKDKVTMSGYIVSEAGMEFKVHWVDSEPPSHLSVEIRMDGRRMGVVSHVKGSSKTSNAGFRVAVDAVNLYHFSPLATHDDDDLPSAYTQDLGTIEIRLRRALDFVPVSFTPKKPMPGGSVHEHKTKGRGTGSHCVSLGGKREVKASSTVLKPLLIDDKPYAIFRFYYRPREYLESKGIIRGRSPSSSSSATVVGSSRSLANRNHKRQLPPSEGRPSQVNDSPIPSKRQRTVFEENDDVSTSDLSTPAVEEDEDRPTPAADEDEDENGPTTMAGGQEGDKKENVVEVCYGQATNAQFP